MANANITATVEKDGTVTLKGIQLVEGKISSTGKMMMYGYSGYVDCGPAVQVNGHRVKFCVSAGIPINDGKAKDKPDKPERKPLILK